MNRRLQQFLELEQLKPAQFADIMGIQRANVSHILSGRNKPSFEFIQKFLLKFPSVNPDWFLLGKGKPFREQDQPASPLPSDNGDLFSGQSGHIDINSPQEIMDDNDDEMILDDSEEPRTVPRISAKEVRRITLFYSDGTFQEFYPPK